MKNTRPSEELYWMIPPACVEFARKNVERNRITRASSHCSFLRLMMLNISHEGVFDAEGALLRASARMLVSTLQCTRSCERIFMVHHLPVPRSSGEYESLGYDDCKYLPSQVV